MKMSRLFSVNASLHMNFTEVISSTHGAVDPKLPLIYLWESVTPEGRTAALYVGKAKRGAKRPRNDYRRNVENCFAGKPYRKGKPHFRAVHLRMVDALRQGHRLQLTLVCNVCVDENINTIEARWAHHYGVPLCASMREPKLL